VEQLSEGEEGEIIVAETPFYGEIGGQIGDTGTIEGKDFIFEVQDTHRPLDNLISHIGRVRKGQILKGDPVVLKVAEEKRRATEANHSGTHVLQAALKTVLGDHIKQSGSLVNAERLRFDFTHFSKIEDDELEQIENLANAVIRRNLPVVTQVLPIEEAMKTGATAVFDEKNGDGYELSKWVISVWNSAVERIFNGQGTTVFSKIVHEIRNRCRSTAHRGRHRSGSSQPCPPDGK
jgi:alanyl-tRNA synthetase